MLFTLFSRYPLFPVLLFIFYFLFSRSIPFRFSSSKLEEFSKTRSPSPRFALFTFHSPRSVPVTISPATRYGRERVIADQLRMRCCGPTTRRPVVGGRGWVEEVGCNSVVCACRVCVRRR